MKNKLTERLLAEGWTRDHFPDNVLWTDFENFGYRWEEKLKMRWRTGCGLCVEPRSAAMCDTTYNGIWYCVENDNPAIRCPYSRRDCEYNIPGLKFPWCVCRKSEAPYDPDNSVEKVENELSARQTAQYLELTGGQYCICVREGNGMKPGVYRVEYDVEDCIRIGCRNPVCSITKRPRDLRKVNIYYDIRRTWITRQGFLEETKSKLEKGVKVFEKPAAMTDAEIWLAQKKAQFDPFRDKHIISPRMTPLDRQQEYFSDHHRQWPDYDYFEFSYSVENIRIEARESRDLLQDLRDVADGVEVVHKSDLDRAKKEKKSNAKAIRAAQEEKARKKRLARRIMEADDELANLLKGVAKSSLGAEAAEELYRRREEKAAGIGEQFSLF